MAAAVLICLGVITGYAAFNSGGTVEFHWRISMLAIAAVALFCLGAHRQPGAPELDRKVRFLLICLLAYVALQVVPLPVPVLDVISPERGEATRDLTDAGIQQTFGTLSVAPGLTLYRLFTMATYVLTFLLIREAAWTLRRKPWWVMLPLIVIAFLEAATGITQHVTSSTATAAHGTYVNRNQFAGMLEAVLPFAVLYPVYSAMQMTEARKTGAKSGVVALLSVGAATTIFVGILFSLSRMGFAAALLSLFFIAALSASVLLSARARVAAVGALLMLTVLAFVFLPPDGLIERFAQLAASEHFKSETRLQLWMETLRLAFAYPLTGCGAGAYESAFLKFQDMVPLTAVEFAHNDYLQLLSELGIVGFAVVLALVILIVRAPFGAWRSHPTQAGRMAALGCIASFTSLLLHCFVDFQLFIPVNGLMMSWVGGFASALQLEWQAISISDVLGTPPVVTMPVTAAR